MNWRTVLLIAAIILFVLAGMNAMEWIGDHEVEDFFALIALGLAFGAASRLP